MGNPEDIPESEVLLQDTSIDGRLGITIWRDATPQTEWMRLRNIGSMGIVRFFDIRDGASIFERRLPLIEKFGSSVGLTEGEANYWYIQINHPVADAA